MQNKIDSILLVNNYFVLYKKKKSNPIKSNLIREYLRRRVSDALKKGDSDSSFF